MARYFHEISSGIPLIGHIAFGIVDRGTNLLQVRPSSFCPLSCIFCSVNAGPKSTNRQTEFVVDAEYLVEWFKHVTRVKELEKAHAYIDAVGDPLTYRDIVKLVRLLRESGLAETIAIETHGALLNRRLVDQLDEAGLDRINLSVDSLDPELAKRLSDTPWLDVKRIVDVAEYIASSTKIDLLVAPVWVPGINDHEIPKIIEWALRIGAGKRVPPLGVQKYEAHKYGRRPPGDTVKIEVPTSIFLIENAFTLLSGFVRDVQRHFENINNVEFVAKVPIERPKKEEEKKGEAAKEESKESSAGQESASQESRAEAKEEQ